MLWTENDAPVVSKAACGFATAEVRVQPPSGALEVMPPCCNGSLPSWYGGSVGSIPTGGSVPEGRRQRTEGSERQKPKTGFVLPSAFCPLPTANGTVR